MITHQQIISWLQEEDSERLEELWSLADNVRREKVGNAVHLRGLIEISNRCQRQCAYCGLNVANTKLNRYTMSKEEILDCANRATQFKYGTVVIQAGETSTLSGEFIADVVRSIKAKSSLAVTLSLGERPDEELRLWREAGANRYLLRFETSNRELFRAIHPATGIHQRDRIEMLESLRTMGYEIGSGVMIGLPGQSYSDLARDIELFAKLDLDMIGVGPYIAQTDEAIGEMPPNLATDLQVPCTELMVYKVVALARLVCPEANIPSTTALATLNLATGRELGMSRGANVVMPNLTPRHFREHYEIYPNKACLRETADQCHACMARRIFSIGREPGTGPGGRRGRKGDILECH